MRLLIALAWAAALLGCDSGEPDFAVQGPVQTVTLARGQLGEVEVVVERIGGHDRTVVVTAGGLRAGITPGALSVGPADDGGILTFAVETSATLGPIDGAYLLGVAGDLERTTPLMLTVVEP